jgi:hypothetical protein
VNELLDAAYAYAGYGWSLLPLETIDARGCTCRRDCGSAGKHPVGSLVEHGLLDATTDAGRIAGWWKVRPDANIGIRTGIDFDALDIDGPAAMTALDGAQPDPPEFPIIGPTVQTPRGFHVYVDVTGLGNTVNLGGIAGLDWRGRDGYVVAPPSRKGEGGSWSWYAPDDPLYGPGADIRPAPAWLLELREKRGRVSEPHSHCGDRSVRSEDYGRRALEGECGKVALAPEGARNHTLNVAAFSLGQLVAGGVLGFDEVVDALLLAAARCGLTEGEARATIASGLRAGFASPRGVAC